MTFEHKQISFRLPRFAGEAFDVIPILDDFGSAGWKLVSVIILPNGIGCAFFSREVSGRNPQRKGPYK